MNIKRQHGQFFTTTNPFGHPVFWAWAERAGLPNAVILEPFAGANNIVRMLEDVKLVHKFVSFDIDPKDSNVQKRDTLSNFPPGFSVVVTNPPWLAKNSAARRGLDFPPMEYEDLYQYALKVCLDNVDYVAAIIPESFMQAGVLFERCTGLISLAQKMFDDTEHPVCLALFEPHGGNPEIWSNDRKLGDFNTLRSFLPLARGVPNIRFNAREGQVGLYAVDAPAKPSIRFVRGSDINADIIKHSSRAITRIFIEGLNNTRIDALVKLANVELARVRTQTCDVFLTSFKGLRKDGQYRRRLDFAMARLILEQAWRKLSDD